MGRHRSLWIALVALLLSGWARPLQAQARSPIEGPVGQVRTDPNPAPVEQSDATPTVAGDFLPIRDQAGILTVDVPAGWVDVSESEWMVAGQPVGIRLTASPNQRDFAANWGVPGVAINFSASLPATLSPEALLDTFDYARTCEDAGRDQLPAGERTVLYQIWQNCAANKSAALVLVLSPAQTRDYYAVIEVYMASPADVAGLGRILTSLQVNRAGADPAAQPVAGDTQAAPTVIPVIVAAATPAPVAAPVVQGTVLVDRLNVRSGPAVDQARLGLVTRGALLTVIGQTGNCAWLQVKTPDGITGWVSGDSRYFALNAPCSSVAPAP